MSVNGEPLLQLDDVHTYYGSIHALKGITVDVREGEIVTLIGANGAGKTTTLRTIMQINKARSGRIRFEGRDITTVPPHEIVKRGIAQSPEGRRLFPRMTVTENLEMGAFQRSDRAGIRDSGSPRKKISPRRGRRSPDTARSVVVFPAPFEPSSATISPSCTSRASPWSTCTSP